MLLSNLDKYQIVLASQSPRRKDLLEELGLNFIVKSMDVDENFDSKMEVRLVAEHLAQKKTNAFTLNENNLVIGADTVVVSKNQILGKPKDRQEAVKFLQKLSEKTHEVITGVSVCTMQKSVSFSASSFVQISKLDRTEIDFYIDRYNPYDKAGGYGIQELFGRIFITNINGSYNNIIGLPTAKLYQILKNW